MIGEADSRGRVSAHQLQASLTGEDNGRRVVLRRIGCTLSRAEVTYEHFSRRFVDLGAAGRPTNILQKGGRLITGEMKLRENGEN